MVRIYVICDLEGVSGVIDFGKQCCSEGPYYEQARRLATLELNALVEGALAGGASEIWAWDGHGNFPGGLDVELLHPECRLVMGAGDGGPVGLDPTFAAVFLHGLHAMAGTPAAVLAHSFVPQIEEFVLNGTPMGEIGFNCVTAGSYGVPVAFISGDQAAVNEAAALVPGIHGAVVKMGLHSAACGLKVAPALILPPVQAREVIKEKAFQAVKGLAAIRPLVVAPPYVLSVKYRDSRYVQMTADKLEELSF